MVSQSDSAETPGRGSSSSCADKKNEEKGSGSSSSKKDPFKSRCEEKEDTKCHDSHDSFRQDPAGEGKGRDSGKGEGKGDTDTKCSTAEAFAGSKPSSRACVSADSSDAPGHACEDSSRSARSESDCECSREEQSRDRRVDSSLHDSNRKEPSASLKAVADSTFSKLSSYCKEFAKDCIQSKSKRSDDETLMDACKKTLALPSSKPPSDPKAEKGSQPESYGQVECKKHKVVSCPEKKTYSFADFFPIDARNKKLNECIEKYAKIDPSQVISKCSEFATKTVDASEKCLNAVKKSQKKSLGAAKVKSQGAIRKSMGMLLTPRGRWLVGRWAPSAAVYLTTTALFTVYVTEWRAVLRHVPFYSHLPEPVD